MLVDGSHELAECGQPFHLMRTSRDPCELFRDLTMDSTSQTLSLMWPFRVRATLLTIGRARIILVRLLPFPWRCLLVCCNRAFIVLAGFGEASQQAEAHVRQVLHRVVLRAPGARRAAVAEQVGDHDAATAAQPPELRLVERPGLAAEPMQQHDGAPPRRC